MTWICSPGRIGCGFSISSRPASGQPKWLVKTDSRLEQYFSLQAKWLVKTDSRSRAILQSPGKIAIFDGFRFTVFFGHIFENFSKSMNSFWKRNRNDPRDDIEDWFCQGFTSFGWISKEICWYN